MSETPETAPATPLAKLLELVPSLFEEVGYSELYGYDLASLADQQNGLVIRDRLLTKFLTANKDNVKDAAAQLKKTLAWRKEFNPLSAGFLEEHQNKFKKLGVITSVPLPAKAEPAQDKEEPAANADETTENAAPAEPSPKVQPEEVKGNLIMTWNLYSDVKNKQDDFSDFDAFLRWRVGAMERGIALLDFTQEPTSYMAQLHDYNHMSILRMDSVAKEATKQTIRLFQTYYPEILNVQYVVNIPTVWQIVFSFIRLFVAKQTLEKFSVSSNGIELAKQAGDWVPKEYGGSAETLEELEAKEISARHPELIKLYVPKPAEEKAEAAADKDKATPPAVPPKPEEETQGSSDEAGIPPETHVDVSQEIPVSSIEKAETPKPAVTAAF